VLEIAKQQLNSAGSEPGSCQLEVGVVDRCIALVGQTEANTTLTLAHTQVRRHTQAHTRVVNTMTSSYSNTTPSPAQTVPKATGSSTGSSSSKGSYYDDHDNQLLHVNSGRQGSAAASSAPGPGLSNGTASDDLQMRWWW